MSLHELLRRASLLRGIGDDEVERLVASARVRDVDDGRVVFSHGDPGDTVLVVLDGAVELVASAARSGEPVARRSARRGATLGEEALLLTSGVRGCSCRAVGHARVAELSAAAVVRAAVRSGGEELGDRLRRRARRAWAREVIEAAWGSDDLDARVDAARLERVRAGEAFGSEAAASEALIVAQGACVDVDSAGDIGAHLEQGAWTTTEEGRSVRALADAWLVRVPSALAPGRGELAGEPKLELMGHIARARRRTARSLLVLDAGRCVGCDECERACGDAHGDGLARFDRSAARALVGERAATLARTTNACQHCASPACLPECPVSAIARDSSGRVTIDAASCTGCGACARACPWDAVRITPRATIVAGRSPAVALKCDLCGGGAAQPACVRACPADALVRVDGTRREERDTGPRAAPPSPGAWWRPALAGAALLVYSLPLSRRASGLVLLIVWVALALHSVARRRVSQPHSPATWTAARLRRAHEVAGALSLALAAAHGGVAAMSAAGHAVRAGAVLLAMSASTLALARRSLPTRVAALEAVAAEGHDDTAHDGSADAAFYRVLSGADTPLKSAYRALAAPYARSRLATFVAVVSGLDAGREMGRMRASLARRLGGHVTTRLGAVDELFRVAVSVRARRALRWARAIHAFASNAHAVAAYVVVAVAVVHGVLSLWASLR